MADETQPRSEPSGAPSSVPHGGGTTSEDVSTRQLPVSPVAVKPLAPSEPRGSSSGSLSPANQSQAGMGLQFHFGKGAKEKPKPDDDSEDSDE